MRLLSLFILLLVTSRAPSHAQTAWKGDALFDHGKFVGCSVVRRDQAGIEWMLGLGLRGIPFIGLSHRQLALTPDEFKNAAARVDSTVVGSSGMMVSKESAHFSMNQVPNPLYELMEGDRVFVRLGQRQFGLSLDGSRTAVKFLVSCTREHGAPEVVANLDEMSAKSSSQTETPSADEIKLARFGDGSSLSSSSERTEIGYVRDWELGELDSFFKAPDFCTMYIIGTIQAGDDDRFKEQVLRAFADGCLLNRLVIYSPGGSLKGALGIADQVKSLNLTVTGPWDGFGRGPTMQRTRKCYAKKIVQMSFDPVSGRGSGLCVCASACAYIFMAGKVRDATVLLHRPYMSADSYDAASTQQMRESYDNAMALARKSLSDNGLPEAIISRMFATNSQEAFPLSDEDRYTLMKAPYYEEAVIAKCGNPDSKKAKEPGFSDCKLSLDVDFATKSRMEYLNKNDPEKKIPESTYPAYEALYKMETSVKGSNEGAKLLLEARDCFKRQTAKIPNVTDDDGVHAIEACSKPFFSLAKFVKKEGLLPSGASAGGTIEMLAHRITEGLLD